MESLDSGWALIFGAVIALAGSVFAPWIRDASQRRHVQEEQLRDEQRKALLAYQDSALVLLRMRSVPDADYDRGAVLSDLHRDDARLQLCLPKKDAAIGDIVSDLTVRVSAKDAQDDRWYALGGYRAVTSHWFRHQITADEALREYTQGLRERADERHSAA